MRIYTYIYIFYYLRKYQDIKISTVHVKSPYIHALQIHVLSKCAWRNMGKTYDHMILKKPIRHSRPISSHSSDPEDFCEWISHDQSIYIIINKQPQQFKYEISEIICSRHFTPMNIIHLEKCFSDFPHVPGIPRHSHNPKLGRGLPKSSLSSGCHLSPTWGFNQLVQTRCIHNPQLSSTNKHPNMACSSFSALIISLCQSGRIW